MLCTEEFLCFAIGIEGRGEFGAIEGRGNVDVAIMMYM